MKTFKTPIKTKIKPFASGIAPDGRLFIAYKSWMGIQAWDDALNIWNSAEAKTSYSFNFKDGEIRPLHIVANYGDAPTSVQIEINDKNQLMLNLIDGKVYERPQGNFMVEWGKEKYFFSATPFGMAVAVASFSFDPERYEADTTYKIYVAEWDWNNYSCYTNPALYNTPEMKFKFFAGFDGGFCWFGANQNRCVHVNRDRNQAKLVINHGVKTTTEIKLELSKGWRMLQGVSVSDSLTCGLIDGRRRRGGNELGTARIVRFYNPDGSEHHDFVLPHWSHTILLSPDCLKLTAIGYREITQIDLDG